MNQQKIYEIMDIFDKSGIAELEIEESEGFKIRLKKADVVAMNHVPTGNVVQAPATEIPVASETPQQRSDTEIITSPIVGTFYRSPAPDAPAFVEEGGKVKAGDSIGIIEAMKIMNKLEADFACEIVSILAENGQMVEYGAPLFEVKRV